MGSSNAIYRPKGTPLIGQFRTVSPQMLYLLAGRLTPWFSIAAACSCLAGLYFGFFVAPTDPEQGESHRILLIYIPAVWLAGAIYLAMATAAGLGFFYRTAALSMLATGMAPTGALFAFLAVWSGALWGKPNFGAWFLSDPLFTTEGLILALFLGFIALQAAIEQYIRADRAGAALSITGAAMLPLVYLALRWWTLVHQLTDLSVPSPIAMDNPMLVGTLLMAAGLMAYATAAIFARVRSVILERERRTDWVAQLLNEQL